MNSSEAAKRLKLVRMCVSALLFVALTMLVVVLAPTQAHAATGKVYSSSVAPCTLNVYLGESAGSATKAASVSISGSWKGSKPSFNALHNESASNGSYSVSIKSASASGKGVKVSIPSQTCSTKKDVNKYQQVIVVKAQITAPAHYWAWKDSSSTVSNSYETARLNICEYQANGSYSRWTGSEVSHNANGTATGTVKVQINVKNMGLLEFATNSKKTKYSSGSGTENVYLGQNRVYAKANLNGGKGGNKKRAFYNGYSSSGEAFASSASDVTGWDYTCSETSAKGWASDFLPSKPTKSGYTFAGWEVKMSGGSYSSCTPSSYTYDNKKSASSGDVNRGPGSVHDTVIVFKALWTAKATPSHSVKYYLDGVLQSNLTATVKEGATYTLAAVPVKSGYTVSGWYANASCTGSVTSSYITKTMGSADVSWYAKSTMKTVVPPSPAVHSVNYYLDGVLQAGLSETVEEGASYTLASLPLKPGYTVSGWYASSSCTGTRSSAQSAKAMGSTNVNWYAKSTANTITPVPIPDPGPVIPSTYTITYVVNPGTSAARTSTVSVKEGAVYTVGAGVPVYSGTLVGWYGDFWCSGARTSSGSSATATSSKTWYAYTTHKVSFVVDPGTAGETALELLSPVRYGQTVTLPVGSANNAHVTKAGCESWSSNVNAWFSDKGCTQKTNACTVTGDAVFYTYNVAAVTYDLATYAKSLDAAEGGLHQLYSSPPAPSSPTRDTMRAHLPFTTKLFKYGSTLEVGGDATLYWLTSSGSARSVQSVEGAYVDDPSASGSAVASLAVYKSATLYKEYTQGVYDGVIGS